MFVHLFTDILNLGLEKCLLPVQFWWILASVLLTSNGGSKRSLGLVVEAYIANQESYLYYHITCTYIAYYPVLPNCSHSHMPLLRPKSPTTGRRRRRSAHAPIIIIMSDQNLGNRCTQDTQTHTYTQVHIISMSQTTGPGDRRICDAKDLFCQHYRHTHTRTYTHLNGLHTNAPNNENANTQARTHGARSREI